MPLWETCSWLTSQLNMTRMFTLLPGSSWTWGWCFCLLGGTELLLCFSSPPSLQLQELLFSWCSLPPDKTTLLVLLAGGEVGFLTYIWSGTFTSPTVTGSPRSSCFPDFGQPNETWRLGHFCWVTMPCLSGPLVLSCTMLSKSHCLTFRSELGAWGSRNRTAGPGGTWAGAMGLCLWIVGLSSGGPVSQLPASWNFFQR